MRFFYMLLICALSSAYAQSSSASDKQFNTGKNKAAVCMTCHGRDGIAAQAAYPNLQGQHAEYMVIALKAYKSKQRNGGLADIMQQMAEPLSEQDMKDIAYYYSKVTSANK